MDFKRGYLYFHSPSEEYFICHVYDGSLLLTGLDFNSGAKTDTVDAEEEGRHYSMGWQEIGPLGNLSEAIMGKKK